MILKRVFMPMLLLGIILAMGSMAYAQTTPGISCTLLVGPTPATVGPPALLELYGRTERATATGHTEPIAAGPDGDAGATASGETATSPGSGKVRVQCTNTSGVIISPTTVPPWAPTSLAVAQLSLGVPITNSTNHPTAAQGIRVENATGPFAGLVTIAGVANSAGTVTIQITAATFPIGGVGTFDISGILVSLNGTGKTSVDATLTVGGGAGYTVTDNVKSVIGSVLPALKDPTVPGSLPTAVTAAFPAAQAGIATFNLSSPPVGIKQTFALRIEENYIDMFKNNNQFNGGGAGVFPQSNASDTVVQLQFSNIPVGITIGGCGAVLTKATDDTLSSGNPTLSSSSVLAGSNVMTVNFNAAVDLLNPDVLWIVCTQITQVGVTSLPGTAVSVQASMAPAGIALSSTGGVQNSVTAGQIPRYQLALQPATALTIVTFPPASVSLLIPFAVVGGGFNTGIAISNTTTDPLGATGGSLVIPQNGSLTFTLYDNAGTVKTYTTVAASPGGGLTSGVLNSGKTYVVNLSELLTASGSAATFTGYIFISVNFTNAHGAAYVYNGAGFTSSTPVLVLGNNRGTPETLGQ